MSPSGRPSFSFSKKAFEILSGTMRSTKLLSLLACFLLLCFSDIVYGGRPRISFQHWFSDVEVELSSIVANNCSQEFQEYLDERIVLYGVHCVRTFNCIVSNCKEYTKANMASASVLLGLLPAILAALGSSTTELSRLSARRPLLAIIMVLGSPAANPIRTFDYHNPERDLEFKEGELEIREAPDVKDRLIVAIQLIAGLGCVINLGQLCWTINLYSVSVMSCDYSDILVEMWLLAALITHFLGVMTFLTRAQTSYVGGVSKRRWWKDWHRNEFRTCVKHTAHRLTWKRENKSFIILSWCTSVFTIIHLAYGTIQFSSMFFVGTPDTLQIVGRFMVSAVVCRAIVAYELAGQKIAAKWHIYYESYMPLIEHDQDQGDTPNLLPAEIPLNRSRSDLQRMPCPDDGPGPSRSEGRHSLELRPLNPQNPGGIATAPESTC